MKPPVPHSNLTRTEWMSRMSTTATAMPAMMKPWERKRFMKVTSDHNRAHRWPLSFPPLTTRHECSVLRPSTQTVRIFNGSIS
jgi:hypothetical protein